MKRFALLLFLLVVGMVASEQQVYGQLAEKSDVTLVNELKNGMSGGLIGVRPILEELSKRTEGKVDQETYLFLLALSYQDEYAETQKKAVLEKAQAYYSEYLKKFPKGIRSDFARFNLAGVYADLGEVDKALKEYEIVYRSGANPVFRAQSRNQLAEIYIKEGRANEGIPIFMDAFKSGVVDPELRTRAVVWLVQGYLADNKPNEVVPYLRYLTGQYESVYDPAFNVTLLKEGDRLFDAGEYDQAILLYTFVKGREEIVQFYQNLVRELSQKVQFVDTESEQFIVINSQLQSAKARLEAVQAIRAYDVDMLWRMARVYKETKRTWESLWAFVQLHEQFPNHAQAEDFLYTAYGEARTLN
ncbi:MAG: tetratricopeptide repeat protein, partial [Puniceicoccales bacterium]